MPEHVHEWELTHPYIPSTGESQQIDIPRSDAVNMIVCHECGTLASWEHILKALNATEELDAATAIGASVTVSADRQSKALLAYAAALENEDV